MNRIFRPRGFFTVPDGTEVSAFLNATDDSQDDVPWGALGDMSIAAGRIGAGVHSAIHMHPVVTQVTYLVSGRLGIRMQDDPAAEPYDLHLAPGEAVVVRPRTLFQLRNTSDAAAEVLYLVSPSYVFEMDGKRIVHDDATVLGASWEALRAAPASAMNAYQASAARAESVRRLAARKGETQVPLTQQAVLPLRAQYDYLAPDGSEIRLLVNGEHGGLAHCVLPAGRKSSAVRHRTVEELWYVLEGQGEIWRGRAREERVDRVRRGDSIRIPVGTAFQFRAATTGSLELLIATMPPWPGAQEAVSTDGRW